MASVIRGTAPPAVRGFQFPLFHMDLTGLDFFFFKYKLNLSLEESQKLG